MCFFFMACVLPRLQRFPLFFFSFESRVPVFLQAIDSTHGLRVRKTDWTVWLPLVQEADMASLRAADAFPDRQRADRTDGGNHGA